MSAFLRGFVPDLLAGMVVNFEIAGLALLVGLLAGAPLAVLRLRGGVLGGLAGAVVALLWACPTFVMMFFLVNVLPLTGLVVVILSQGVFATAFVCDNGVDAVRHARRGAWGSALLFLPQVARAFFVMVTSSSQAAAIGVLEAVTVTLRAGERLPGLGERLTLFLGVVTVFVVLQRTAFHAIDWCRLRLLRRLA